MITTAAPKAGETPVRTALIGCGRWGRNIGRVLAQLGSLKLIVDPAAEQLRDYADGLSADVSSDLNDAFQNDISAIAIAAPAVDHGRLARLALEAGKHVFVEKPLALNVGEAQELAEEAERRGLVLMVGHLLQYHPAFTRLKEVVAEGAIGEIRHITSNRLNSGAIRTEENALWSMGPHDFSMILALAGRQPLSVHSLAVRVVRAVTPDQFMVQMRFSNSLTAQASVSWMSPYKEHRLVVLGTTGAIVFEDTAASADRKLLLYRDYVDDKGGAPRFVKGAGEPIDYPTGEPLVAEMQWFLDSVRGLKTPRTGPEEAIPVLELLWRAERAATPHEQVA